ncbi:MAG: hypothetical protein AABX52_04685 [Nanoarchaeota archaeon]
MNKKSQPGKSPGVFFNLKLANISDAEHRDRTHLRHQWMRWPVGIGTSLGIVPSVMAHCPVCTAAAGAAVSVARWYGVDDSLVGVLIGGFIVSTALWADNTLKKQDKNFVYNQDIVFILLATVITIIGFKISGLFETNSLLFGLPRLLSGMVIGIFVSTTGHRVHGLLRAKNNGKNFISLQGTSILIGSLLLASTVLIIGGFV